MKLKASVLALALAAFAGHAMAASVAGHWVGEVKLPTGQALPFIADLSQSGETVSGKLAGINGAPDVQVMDGMLVGERLTFWGIRTAGAAQVKFNYVGVVGPEAIDIQILRDDGSAAPLATRVTRAAAR